MKDLGQDGRFVAILEADGRRLRVVPRRGGSKFRTIERAAAALESAWLRGQTDARGLVYDADSRELVYTEAL